MLNITLYLFARQSRSTSLVPSENSSCPRVEIDWFTSARANSRAREKGLQIVESDPHKSASTVAGHVATSNPSAHGCGLNTGELSSCADDRKVS